MVSLNTRAHPPIQKNITTTNWQPWQDHVCWLIIQTRNTLKNRRKQKNVYKKYQQHNSNRGIPKVWWQKHNKKYHEYKNKCKACKAQTQPKGTKHHEYMSNYTYIHPRTMKPTTAKVHHQEYAKTMCSFEHQILSTSKLSQQIKREKGATSTWITK